jgi:LacI family transcriptional regulator
MAATLRKTRKVRRRPLRAEVTIHDVAARAGVSVATVSRVLNGKELVREETSASVLEAARVLRYVPNVAARALSIRRSHTLGIVLPDLHGEFFSELIRGIDLAARRAGYHVLVSGSHSNAQEMLEVLDTMRGRVDGLVVMAPDLSTAGFRDALAGKMPIVILSSRDDEHDAITIDNYGGARRMMEHLLSLGHTRIAFVCGPPHNSDARERLRGYRHAMRNGGERCELPGDFTERAGAGAAAAILELRKRPTAVFAANDAMAVGLLGGFSDAGVRVPKEIAVTGFDDIPIARYIAPALTTVRVDIAEIGRRAFALLNDRLEDGSSSRAHRHESVTTTLIVRKSCGAGQRRAKTAKGEKA